MSRFIAKISLFLALFTLMFGHSTLAQRPQNSAKQSQNGLRGLRYTNSLYYFRSANGNYVIDENQVLVPVNRRLGPNLRVQGVLGIRGYTGIADVTLARPGTPPQSRSVSPPPITNIDRLAFQMRAPKTTLIVGKTTPLWRSPSFLKISDIFNPSSIINPYSKSLGIPLVQIQHQVTNKSQVNIIYAYPQPFLTPFEFDTQWDGPPSGGIQYTSAIGKTNILLGMVYSGELETALPTIGLRSAFIGKTILHVDIISKMFRRTTYRKQLDSTLAVIGVTGLLSPSMAWYSELLFNQPAFNPTIPSIGTNFSSLSGDHYLVLGTKIAATRTTSVSASILGNLTTGSGVGNLELALPVVRGLKLHVKGHWFIGRNNQEFAPARTGISSIYLVQIQKGI